MEVAGGDLAVILNMGKMSTCMVWNVEIGYKSGIVDPNQHSLLLVQQFSHLPQ